MNAPQTAVAMRHDFTGSEELAIVETSSSAVAAQSKAMVESRYIMAMRAPRDWDQVRQNLLRECRRPAFANNKSAYYRKPIGQGVEGLGIRFVEVALRCMRNVLVETSMIFEDATKEVHRVSVTDLESNITYPLDVRVSKTVERSKPMDDGSYISVRKNSYNKDVFTVPANDDDLLNKRGALISKAMRTLGLRIIPGDLQDEAEEIIKGVRLNEAAADPDATRKKIVDAFGEIGVKATDLAEYLGHSLDSCSPTELVDLRGIYGAIRDGEATWKTVMENAQTGDKKTTAAPATYPDDKFGTELPKWRAMIKAGKKTAEQIIATAQSKHPLTDTQKEAISAPDAAEEKPDLAQQIEKQLNSAKDLDVLSIAADLIGEVADPQSRSKLTELYNQRKETLSQ